MTPPQSQGILPEDPKHVPLPLAAQIEELFARAEPRLLRLARAQQIAPHAVEDVVQETLLEAWKSLAQLREESRFAAWLDGICLNICRRHQRKQGMLSAHETGWEDNEESSEIFAHLADPATFDPTEEFTQRDVAFLLDRALGYLAPENRIVVEQHYLADIPQRELAARMGLTLSALEARLHRSRKHLLHILSHDLRAEAMDLGLAINPADAMGWRKTSMWCMFCGKQHLMGIFEPMPDGRIDMQLSCSWCKVSVVRSSVAL